MVALTTIEVLEPQLYQWISRNKDLLCSTYFHSFSALYRNKSDYRTSICEELRKLGMNTDIGIKFLSTLFPVFANDIDECDYKYTESNIRETMRVAQEERFDSYFMFDLKKIPISRYIINNCINELELNDLIVVVSKINDAGNIEYFIDELSSLVDTIPTERLGLLSLVILNVLHKFSQNSQFFMLSAYTKAEFLVYSIMCKINDENERYNLIKSVLEKTNKEQIDISLEEDEQIYEEELTLHPEFDFTQGNDKTLEQAIKKLETEKPVQRFPQLEYFGQMHGTYLFAQSSDGLYIIDQQHIHTAVFFPETAHGHVISVSDRLNQFICKCL